jgi:NADH:ubiquinone oxidoreductase subunit 5 (subunit L)/multisubunit Na+/H+ antiporter MnhA subunit
MNSMTIYIIIGVLAIIVAIVDFIFFIKPYINKVKNHEYEYAEDRKKQERKIMIVSAIFVALVITIITFVVVDKVRDEREKAKQFELETQKLREQGEREFQEQQRKKQEEAKQAELQEQKKVEQYKKIAQKVVINNCTALVPVKAQVINENDLAKNFQYTANMTFTLRYTNVTLPDYQEAIALSQAIMSKGKVVMEKKAYGTRTFEGVQLNANSGFYCVMDGDHMVIINYTVKKPFNVIPTLELMARTFVFAEK